MTAARLLLLAVVVATISVSMVGGSTAMEGLQTNQPAPPSSSRGDAAPNNNVRAMNSLSVPFLQTKSLRMLPDSHLVIKENFLSRGNFTAHNVVLGEAKTTRAIISKLGSISDDNRVRIGGRITVRGNFIYSQKQAQNQLKEAELAVLQATTFLEVEHQHSTAVLHEPVRIARFDAETGNNDDDYFRQFSLQLHDDFHNTADLAHWKDQSDRALGTSDVKQCSSDVADNTFVVASESHGPVSSIRRSISNLPAHSHILISARVHMIDAWSGAAAFIKVDGEYVWLETGLNDASVNAFSVCGAEHVSDRLSIPVHLVIPHTSSSMVLEFGSSLNSSTDDIAILGVDDVSVSCR